MQSSISSTQFYEGKEITLTATPDSGANGNLFYWVINFTTDDLQYTIQQLTSQGRLFKQIGSSGTSMATDTATVTQQANSINTLTPLLLQMPSSQYIGSAINTALNNNEYFADNGTTYNITWTNPPSPNQKTISGIVTWLRQWFHTKEEIDTLFLTDSGWQSCTISSGYSIYTSGQIVRVRKVGKVVEFSGIVKPTAEKSTTGEFQIVTIPSGYRPSIDQYKVCQGSNIDRWLLAVKSTGVVAASRYGTTSYTKQPQNAWLNFVITYMID